MLWFSVIYVESFSPPKRKHLFLYNHWPHNSVKQAAEQKARIFHWKLMCVINTWIRHPSSLELVLYQACMTQNNTPWIQHCLNVYGIFLRVWSLNLFLPIFLNLKSPSFMISGMYCISGSWEREMLYLYIY